MNIRLKFINILTICTALLITLPPTLQGEGEVGRAKNGNTGEGHNALHSLKGNASGIDNTALGFEALYSNTSGSGNTATGFDALLVNTIGSSNTADGFAALHENESGFNNTAIGYQTLYFNTFFNGAVGNNNTATGYQALYNNTTGGSNTADGVTALFGNTTGNNNTAMGYLALASLMTGEGNTAMGHSALVNSTTGDQNIAVGYFAGQNLTAGTGNIYISSPGVGTESDTIRIGNVISFTDVYGFGHPPHTATYVAGIYGAATSDAGRTTPVVIDASGKLGTVASSERFKRDVKPMDNSSDVILALNPVTFHYKNDGKDTPQFGLIAEDVAKVNPNLVVRDAKGDIYTVRYEAVNAMLLNEFLKEHKKVEALEATAARQQKQIEALTAGLQKVSAQVELNKPSPQIAVNNQ